MYESKSYHC